MNRTSILEEHQVEDALRGILESLDRQLARVTAFFPLALVTVVPAVFFIFWLMYDQTGRRSLVIAGGALYLLWELLASRFARWRFDRHFPPGTTERTIALRILAEMETPSKAE